MPEIMYRVPHTHLPLHRRKRIANVRVKRLALTDFSLQQRGAERDTILLPQATATAPASESTSGEWGRLGIAH